MGDQLWDSVVGRGLRGGGEKRMLRGGGEKRMLRGGGEKRMLRGAKPSWRSHSIEYWEFEGGNRGAKALSRRPP